MKTITLTLKWSIQRKARRLLLVGLENELSYIIEQRKNRARVVKRTADKRAVRRLRLLRIGNELLNLVKGRGEE